MAVSFRVSGKKIRAARHGAQMTQAQLARAVGTSERNIVRWENDQNAPRVQHVSAIAKATGRSVEQLMESDGDVAVEDDPEVPRAMSIDEFLRIRAREILMEEARR